MAPSSHTHRWNHHLNAPGFSSWRGHLATRLLQRVARELQALICCLVFAAFDPREGEVAVSTLDAFEENASAATAILTANPAVKVVRIVSPDATIAERALSAACERLNYPMPTNVQFKSLNYLNLLHAYVRSSQTYSTHILLPGRDPSQKRAHVHLTHGSGPKRDSTFRSPTTILASVVGVWVPAQLEEYRLKPDTPVLPFMPRLEIMRRTRTNGTLLRRLGLDPNQKLVVWAPTYRAIRRRGGEIRISGTPFSNDEPTSIEPSVDQIREAVKALGAQLITKVHPFDEDNFSIHNIPTFTSESLEKLGITAYELFGSADLIITDYSSLLTERAALGKPFLLYCPDRETFRSSYRGFRKPFFDTLTEPARLKSISDLDRSISQLGSESVSPSYVAEIASSLGIDRGLFESQASPLDLYTEVERIRHSKV